MFYESYKIIMMTLTVIGIILILCQGLKGITEKFKKKCDRAIFFTFFLFVLFNINPLLDFIFNFTSSK